MACPTSFLLWLPCLDMAWNGSTPGEPAVIFALRTLAEKRRRKEEESPRGATRLLPDRRGSPLLTREASASCRDQRAEVRTSPPRSRAFPGWRGTSHLHVCRRTRASYDETRTEAIADERRRPGVGLTSHHHPPLDQGGPHPGGADGSRGTYPTHRDRAAGGQSGWPSARPLRAGKWAWAKRGSRCSAPASPSLGSNRTQRRGDARALRHWLRSQSLAPKASAAAQAGL